MLRRALCRATSNAHAVRGWNAHTAPNIRARLAAVRLALTRTIGSAGLLCVHPGPLAVWVRCSAVRYWVAGSLGRDGPTLGGGVHHGKVQAKAKAETQSAVSSPDGPAWGGRRAGEALARVKAVGQARGLKCSICDGVIDYGLEWPELMSCSVQHLLSRNTHPHLTWAPSNWAPAHLTCNSAAGDGHSDPYDIGPTSL